MELLNLNFRAFVLKCRDGSWFSLAAHTNASYELLCFTVLIESQSAHDCKEMEHKIEVLVVMHTHVCFEQTQHRRRQLERRCPWYIMGFRGPGNGRLEASISSFTSNVSSRLRVVALLLGIALLPDFIQIIQHLSKLLRRSRAPEVLAHLSL